MRNPLARRPGVPEPSRDPRPGGTPRRGGPGVLGWLQRLVVGGVVAVLLGWVLLFYVFAPKLPDPRELRAQSEQPTITVLAADGSVLARRGTEGARFIELGEISPWLVKAVVATEDARFYHHFGLDPLGLARAFLVDLKARHVVEGGSTITQQLVKNLYLSSEQTAGRKLQEMVYAIWLESQLSKDEILTLYLNRVYFGAGAYGVEAAAQRYFAKPAKDLTLAEAAMVAGLLKAPSRYAPTNDLDESRDRAATVLDRMVDAGFITQEQAIAARTRPAKLAPDSQTALAGHFVDWALDGLKQEVGKIRARPHGQDHDRPGPAEGDRGGGRQGDRRQGRGARRLPGRRRPDGHRRVPSVPSSAAAPTGSRASTAPPTPAASPARPSSPSSTSPPSRTASRPTRSTPTSRSRSATGSRTTTAASTSAT